MSECAQATRICKERGVQIDIEPAKPWWDAEEYHQKYIQKQRGAHYM
jgi:peptide methionine sulfoxide reductase MsrA